MNWEQVTACSSIAGKRTAILHSIISGRFSGVTSMPHLFQLCMRSTMRHPILSRVPLVLGSLSERQPPAPLVE